MASGVSVADRVSHLYTEMKVVMNVDDHRERLRIVLLHINDSSIDVEGGKIYREKDLEGEEDVLKFCTGLLKDDQCRYLLYDCRFETNETCKKELVLVMWAPENAPVKEKMLYASSKSYLKKICTGIKHDVELHEKEDLQRVCFAEQLGKNITKMEGHPLVCSKK